MNGAAGILWILLLPIEKYNKLTVVEENKKRVLKQLGHMLSCQYTLHLRNNLSNYRATHCYKSAIYYS